MYYHPNHYKKLKATSSKHGGRRKRPTIINEIHDAWARDHGYKASSSRQEAPSPKRQASSSKPEAASSKIREPRNI